MLNQWIKKNTWIWAVMGTVILWILISILAGGISLQTLLLNGTLASFIIFLSLGQMMVITSGEGSIDLSVTYVMTLSAFISSRLMVNMGLNVFLSLILTFLMCAAIGLINGIITIYLQVPAMITTLATGYITYTGILVFSQQTLGTPAEFVSGFAKWRVGNVSSILLLCIVLVILFAVINSRSSYGRKLKAAGQNRRAAMLASIQVDRIVIIAFIISSVLAGLAGILLCGYSGGAFIDMGNAYAITPIAATLLGGTLVSGGKASAVGTFAGGLMLALLVTFITLTKLPRGYQYLIEGAILVLILSASKEAKGRR